MPETTPDDRLRRVDPAAIAAELRAAWRDEAESQPSTVTRALGLNFVLCTSESDVRTVGRTIERVAQALPCRAFVVLEPNHDATAPRLEAWIGSHCGESNVAQIDREQITLRARADSIGVLGATILGLRIADLPTALWCPGGESDLFDHLAALCDRAIVDSAQWMPADTGLAALAERAVGTVPMLDDIAWSRLEPWRELTAAHFDAPPFDRLLRRLHSVRIVHGADGGAEAWLFAGWLASRLGWRARERRDTIVWFESSSGRVEVRLEQTTGSAPAPLRHVRLLAPDTTAFDVELHPRFASLLVSRVERPAACPLPQHRDCAPPDLDTALVRILERRRPNAAFLDALAAAAAAVAIAP